MLQICQNRLLSLNVYCPSVLTSVNPQNFFPPQCTQTKEVSFFVGFMENHQYFPSESNDSFYTSTSKLESVVPGNVTVRDDHTRVLMANPQVSNTFTITSKETRMPPQGIHIQSPDSNEIVVFGSNEEFFSVDGFLALPCPWLQVEQYNYYAVSTWSPPSTSYTVILKLPSPQLQL